MNSMIFKYWFNPTNQQRNSGFTLIELIVVIVIIGILAAIAAPGWIGFVNNRRANGVNDAVLQALNEAKNNARKEKRAYSVSFRTENNIPQIAIHPTADLTAEISTTDAYQANDPADVNNMQGYWDNGDVSKDVDIKANQILIQTNIAARNQKNTTSTFSALPGAPGTQVSSQTITFDHTGELANQSNGDEPTLPLVIRVAVPNASNTTQPIASTIRCIKVQTLLGSLLIGRSDGECSAA